MATTLGGGASSNVYTTMAAPAVHHREPPQREQNNRHGNSSGGDIVKCGLLKKLKTSRKKWFVLRSETADASARLEYYDSEKKWAAGLPAKRSIPLRTCFNINRRQDTKHKHVIALYTKDDCFCVVLESEEELDSWLRALLALQQGDDVTDGEVPRPTFEHVWQVSVLSRGLGNGRTGNYRLCLTDKTLTLIKKDTGSGGTSDCVSPTAAGSVIDLNLSNIRSCGSLKNYFYLEIGRSSLLGAGELWMDSEDVNIAQNIHTTIYHAMTTNGSRSGGSGKGMAAVSAIEGATNEDLAPKTRTRSSSATESRPNNIPRKQVHSGVPKTLTHGLSQAGSGFHFTAANLTAAGGGLTGANSGLRERCDSMPSSGGGRAVRSAYVHHSPPGHGGGSPVSPPSAACSTTDSAGSSYSLADEADVCIGLSQHPHPPLTPDEAIEEEDCCCGGGADHIYGYEEATSHAAGGSYVPMAVPSSDDGYVDMSPRGRAASPAASLASVTSGTPSTDYRFADYPLDKVRSYLATQEEDASRPARAYSLGSRPDGVSVRTRAHQTFSAILNATLTGGGDSYRDRAASVGSKSKRWAGGRVLVHYGGGHPPSAGHAGGGKSSSAPLLPIAGTAPHGSHGSIGPMEDLMEMDFSRGGRHSSSSDTTPSGYVEMKPGVDPLHKKTPSTLDVSPYVDMKPAGQTSSDYVDMSGTSPSKSQTSTTTSTATGTSGKDYSSFVDINRQYSLTSNGRDSDHYTGRQRTFSRPSSSPADDYLDMGGNSRLLSTSPRTGTSIASASSALSDYMPLGFDANSSNTSSSSSKTTTEGYVEMGGTVGATKGHHRQLSLDSHIGSVAESYANMALGQGSKKKPTQTVTSSASSSGSSARKDKQQSQPISIYPTAPSCMSHLHCKTTSSPITSLWGGRKTSAGSTSGNGGGTPPKLHLSITSPFSSLPRQRHRRDSSNAVSSSAETDSVSSGSSITTPSSSSTIFPLSLNSPSSPMKPSTSSSGKTETPTALKIPAAILNAFYKSGSSSGKSTSNVPVRQAPIAAPEDDYTLMDFQTSSNAANAPSQQAEASSRVSADDDYMMCSPATVEAVVSNVNERIQPESAQAQPQTEEREEKDKDIEPPYEVLRSSAEAPSSSGSIAETSTGSTPNSTETPPKLHYASLDLAQQDADACASGNAAQQPPNKPTYAQIDFIRTTGEDPGTKQSGGSQPRTGS
nr:unnamed protein product [Callosobruchus analis]